MSWPPSGTHREACVGQEFGRVGVKNAKSTGRAAQSISQTKQFVTPASCSLLTVFEQRKMLSAIEAMMLCAMLTDL